MHDAKWRPLTKALNYVEDSGFIQSHVQIRVFQFMLINDLRY